MSNKTMSRTWSKMKSRGRSLNRRVARSTSNLRKAVSSKSPSKSNSKLSKPSSKRTMSHLDKQSSSDRPAPPPTPPPPLSKDAIEPASSSRKTVVGHSRRSFDGVGSRKDSSASEPRRYSDPSTLGSSTIPTPPPMPSEASRSRNAPRGGTISAVSNNETIAAKSETRGGRVGSEIIIERNDVPFYDEDACTDSEDEFNFTCCIPPYSPRYPPNPRPRKEWDPSLLPQGTNIPTSLGRPCRRCGKLVYLAELHLSSRGAYHTECYKCCLCGKTLDSWTVAEYKGEIFCKGCYRRNFGTHGTGFGVGAGVLQTP